MSTVVATKNATDMFATMWAVKMMNFLGLSDIIPQCDPEPSLIKWAESVKSKRSERTVIRSSPRRSHQSNGGVENYQKQLQGQVRTKLAAMQERRQYRPTADSALMRWIVRHAACNTVDTVSENNAGCELTRQKQRSRPHHNCN